MSQTIVIVKGGEKVNDLYCENRREFVDEIYFTTSVTDIIWYQIKGVVINIDTYDNDEDLTDSCLQIIDLDKKDELLQLIKDYDKSKLTEADLFWLLELETVLKSNDYDYLQISI